MAFTTKTRYGAQESYADHADIAAVVEELIRELETEQFDEPDDEHTQIVIECGDWAVTVYVSGLMTLDHLPDASEGGSGFSAFKRATHRDEAAEMLTLMAEGALDAVRASGWVSPDQLPPWERDLFRANG